MTAQYAEMTRAALTLSTDEKLSFAEQLVAVAGSETSPEHEAAWQTEVQRRREEVLCGKEKLVPGDEVERSLDRLLG
ncbi:MAG: addiction module protein [Undibacterium sp.]|nr:addiction module protein [Opitutaceae bacterium]